MKRIENGALVAFTVLLVTLAFSIMTWVNFSEEPEGLTPGDSVAILSGRTVIQNEQPCQEYQTGFVSPTGPERENYWYKAERFIYPANTLISVIDKEGKVTWQLDHHVVKMPAAPEELVCPRPIE